MIIFKKVKDLHHFLRQQKNNQLSIGFIPTMGALHDGHLSLLKIAKQEDQITVCSIFVNPTQFNDARDYEKYPVTIEEDILKLEKNGNDVLFLPSVEEIYPTQEDRNKKYDLKYLGEVLEGEYRPGHFQGVCMVVHRLLEIVRPAKVYLGQKDYQQCLVIQQLLSQIGMQEEIKIHICPIIRENDGLAMSSRNVRLSPEQRKTAAVIYQTLLSLKNNINKGSLVDIKQEAEKMLRANGFKIDYVEIADSKTLRPLNEWDTRKNAIGLVAVFLGEVRLIDNMVLANN